jgi:anaerobic magnesium-protoporphyrin IX monomethyl ester cyclase
MCLLPESFTHNCSLAAKTNWRMNIVFSHSYFLRFDPKQWKTGQPYPPLGTLYACSLLRTNGYRVYLHDTMFSHSAAELEPVLNTHHPELFVIYDDGFNYLTKMCLTNMREAAFEMIRIAKQMNCIVIVCSSDSTDHYQKYLGQGADYIIMGEGELTLLELVKAIANGQTQMDNIPGLAYYRDGGLLRTVPRPVLRDLDSLPLPAWDLVNIGQYKKAWLKSSGYFSINMTTTRGCPFKCNWCAKPIYGNRYHSRSPENVIGEMMQIRKHFEFDHIWFCDDIFGLKPGWVQRFSELMRENGLSIPFRIQSRADLLVQENYVLALARAGCDNVWMGAESGSQKILDAMDKGTTVKQIYEATRLLKTNGIKPSLFIQFGYPGETREDISATLDMINELLPHSIGISVSYPLPGTVFYEKVKTELKEKSNWTDSDELQLMFRNTFAPAFYKQLHRYTHKLYRTHLAADQIRKLFRAPSSASFKTLMKAASIVWHLPAGIVAGKKLKKLERN